jgi:hypothetical protein
MTNLERDIRVFILKALLGAGNSPMTDDSLRGAICTRFQHIAMTAADLGAHIHNAQNDGLIAGTNDPVFGVMWALTPGGTIRAKQLHW